MRLQVHASSVYLLHQLERAVLLNCPPHRFECLAWAHQLVIHLATQLTSQWTQRIYWHPCTLRVTLVWHIRIRRRQCPSVGHHKLGHRQNLPIKISSFELFYTANKTYLTRITPSKHTASTEHILPNNCTVWVRLCAYCTVYDINIDTLKIIYTKAILFMREDIRWKR